MICELAKTVDIRKLETDRQDFIELHGLFIKIDRTTCHFGGSREWFLCPDCDRRCVILYPDRCRQCAKGRYQSELESVHNRKIRKAIKIRRRLGQTSGGVLVPFPEKPKRMHWRTYLNLRTRALRIEAEIVATLARAIRRN